MSTVISSRFLSLALALLALPAFIFAAFDAKANDEADVKQFVQNLTDQAVAVAKSDSMTDVQRMQQLGALLKDKADYRWIAGFVAGKGFKNADASQRQRYYELYPQYLVKNYLPKFKNYAGEHSPKIYDVQEKNGKYLVKTKVIGDNGAPLLVDYRIRKTDEGYKIYDVVAEGVSLIVTQRAEFSSFIQRVGIDKFLDKLLSYIKS